MTLSPGSSGCENGSYNWTTQAEWSLFLFISTCCGSLWRKKLWPKYRIIFLIFNFCFVCITLRFLNTILNRCSIYYKVLRKIRLLLTWAKQHKVLLYIINNPVKDSSDGFLGCLRSLWIYQIQRGKIGHCLLHSHLQINNTINRLNTSVKTTQESF